MTAHDIRLLRLAGQHLTAPADTDAIVRDLCGVQAQYVSHAMHALSIRGGSGTDGLVKTWTLRGTMHLTRTEDLPLLLHKGRTHFLRPVDTLADDACATAARKQLFAAVICSELAGGDATRDALRDACLCAGMTETEARSLFDPWGGLIRALCECGRIACLVSEKKVYRLCAPFEPLPAQEAHAELVRRYFTHYGPATIRDAAYFFGRPQKEIRQWMRDLPLTATDVDGQTYFRHAGAPEPSDDLPPVLYLAGFDPLLLGYEKSSGLFLPQENIRDIFSLSGTVRPAILYEGCVAGRWRKEGARLSITLFRPVPKALLEAAALQQLPGVQRIAYDP